MSKNGIHMKSNVKHNKIRNTGILFELLVRKITSDVLENRKSEFPIKLMREYFNSKTQLGKELILYRSFFNVSKLSEEKAFQLLSIISEQRKKLNERELNTQKYNLIKEIKNNYELKEFLNARIPSYKVYASIYKVFDGMVNELTDFREIDSLVSAKFTIVEHLTGSFINKEIKNDIQLFETLKDQEEDLRLLTYRILIEKFNEKYAGLNERQKNLLREYIYNVSNGQELKKYTLVEAEKIIKELNQKLSIITDTVIKIKLHEVISQLEKFRHVQVIKENHMTALLIALEITKAIDNLQG
jgi:hypothetical protein